MQLLDMVVTSFGDYRLRAAAACKSLLVCLGNRNRHTASANSYFYSTRLFTPLPLIPYGIAFEDFLLMFRGFLRHIGVALVIFINLSRISD